MKDIFDPLWFTLRSVPPKLFSFERAAQTFTHDGIRRCAHVRLTHLVFLSAALSLGLGCDEQSPTHTPSSAVGDTSEPHSPYAQP